MPQRTADLNIRPEPDRELTDIADYVLTYRIDRAEKGWRCEAITRGFRVNAEGQVVEIAKRVIVGG